MFIRKTRKVERKSGREYHSFQLIESVRTIRGPRQQILLNLGSDINLTDQDRKMLADRIEEIVSGSNSLFSAPKNIEELAQQFAIRLEESGYGSNRIQAGLQDEEDFQAVNVNAVEVERARSVGVEYAALETIRKLELDQVLARAGLTNHQITLAIGTIIGRLAGRCSERGTLMWLRELSGLGELLDADFTGVSDKGIYEVSDRLLEKRALIEKHLERKESNLFSLENTVVLYDLTNTYFEGRMCQASLAHKGHSKEKRSDCPLVTLGLVLNSQGFPLRSDVFEGNVSEAKTLADMLERLTSPDSRENPIVVMDAGIATESNLEWLRERDYRYIVCSRQRTVKPPEGLNFELVSQNKGNEVQAACQPDTKTGEQHLYCLSKSRKEGELAWLAETRKKYENELKKLQSGLSKKGCTKGFEAVNLKLARLTARYQRLSNYYKVSVTVDESKKLVTKLQWTFDEEAAQEKFLGAYQLRTYGLKWDTQRLWQTYVMLTEVEAAFRHLKSDLGLRPVYHQMDDRIKGHLFISVLAYHILRVITYQLEEAGFHLSWPAVRDRLATQVRVTMKMPTKNGRMLHIRKTSLPEPFHRSIYKALGLTARPGCTQKTYL